MSKKIIIILLLGIVVISSGYNFYCVQNEIVLSDLVLENIEALAQDENGTDVGVCYYSQSFSTVTGYKNFCDSQTDNNRIYPCPKTATYGGYSEMAKDRCTK